MRNANLDKIKELLNLDIDEDVLIRILFDINRYFDKSLTKAFQEQKIKNNKTFNSIERKLLRNYFYHNIEDSLKKCNMKSFPTINFNEEDIEKVAQNTIERLENYDPQKIINSIKKRYENLTKFRRSSISYMNEWLNYYNQKRITNFKYSSFILRITNEDFNKNGASENYLFDLIKKTYKDLENYRHLIIVIEGQIYDKNNNDITWKLAYKLTIYAENFVQYKDVYNPCKKTKQIAILKDFLSKRFQNKNLDFANDFYKTISTGYKFEDCFISNNQEKIIITLKKISRDESPVPCPSCMTTIQSGNSYPEMFLRSFECKNPFCPDRSKSGRGKRFDEYGVYRYFKLEEQNPHNQINYDLYAKWRRDIFDNNLDYLEMLIKYYTWNDETILTYNLDNIPDTLYSRKIIKNYNNSNYDDKNYVKDYDSLPIVILFKNVSELLDNNTGETILKKSIEMIRGDSSQEIRKLKPYQIGTVITSPPYYNAREYSQWQNLLLYLIDMMINASAVYNTLDNEGKYLYNIGDIVAEDNVYVSSHMSKRRFFAF